MKNLISSLFLNLSGSGSLSNSNQTTKASPFFMTFIEKLLQGPRQLLQRFPMVRHEILPNLGLGLSSEIGIVSGLQQSRQNVTTMPEFQMQPVTVGEMKTGEPGQSSIKESITPGIDYEEHTGRSGEQVDPTDTNIPEAVQAADEVGIAFDSNSTSEAELVDPAVTTEEQPSPTIVQPANVEVLSDFPNVTMIEGASNPSGDTQLQDNSPQKALTLSVLHDNLVSPNDLVTTPVEMGSGLERVPHQFPSAPNWTVSETPLPRKMNTESSDPEQMRIPVRNEGKLALSSPEETQTLEIHSDSNLQKGQPRESIPLDSIVNRFNSTTPVKISTTIFPQDPVILTGTPSEPTNAATRLEKVLIQTPSASSISDAESILREKMPINSQNAAATRLSARDEEQLIAKTPVDRNTVEVQTDSNVQRGPIPGASSNNTHLNQLSVTVKAEKPVEMTTSSSTEAKPASSEMGVNSDSPRAGFVAVIKNSYTGDELLNNQPFSKETKTTPVREPAARATAVNAEATDRQESPQQGTGEKSQGKNLNLESFSAKLTLSNPVNQTQQRLASAEDKNFAVGSAQSPSATAKQVKRIQSAPKLTEVNPTTQSITEKPKGNPEKLVPEINEAATIRNTSMNQDISYPIDKAFRLALINRITQLVEQSHQKNSREMTFRIQANDNELLELRFIKDAQNNRGKIVTESEALAEAIQRQMPIIVQNLENKGIHFAELSVALGNTENFSAQARTQANRSLNTRINQARSEKAAIKEEPVKRAYYLGYNTIDYVA